MTSIAQYQKDKENRAFEFIFGFPRPGPNLAKVTVPTPSSDDAVAPEVTFQPPAIAPLQSQSINGFTFQLPTSTVQTTSNDKPTITNGDATPAKSKHYQHIATPFTTKATNGQTRSALKDKKLFSTPTTATTRTNNSTAKKVKQHKPKPDIGSDDAASTSSTGILLSIVIISVLFFFSCKDTKQPTSAVKRVNISVNDSLESAKKRVKIEISDKPLPYTPRIFL